MNLSSRKLQVAIAPLVACSCLAGVARAEGNSSATDQPASTQSTARPVPEDSPYDYDLVLRPGAPGNVQRSVRQYTFSLRPVLLELRTGFGTIVGLLGVTASYDPLSRLSLGAGLGVSPSGAQLAAFARVRPLIFVTRRSARLLAVGVELGYSTGPYSDYKPDWGTGSDPPRETYSYERVHWLEPQITFETRSYGGFNLLAGIGLAIPLAWHGYQCIDPARCASNHISTLPTITVGLGWAPAP